MSMRNYKKFFKNAERGQAIVLIVFAFVGLVAMVGLVIDTGLVLIEYGKLKRSVDAAAIAAAQEYRPDPDTRTLNVAKMESAAMSMLRLNQTQNVNNVVITTCEDPPGNRPALCNPDPINDPLNNRKLVEVTASSEVSLAFLPVLGIRSVTLWASAVGEAATIDLVLVMDTSGSMAYETDGNPRPSSGDDPSVCNAMDNCQPMRRIKDIAMEFVDSLIYFGYDRVAVIAMTGQTPGASRAPVEVIPLSFSRSTILNAINTLKVYQPRVCDGSATEGECLQYIDGVFNRAICEIYEMHSNEWYANPSSCPSSNIGGALRRAGQALSGSGNPNNQRPEALWVVVALIGGPANATDSTESFPNGFCPPNTWLVAFGQDPWCRDPYPSTRHSPNDTIMYTNPHPDYPGGPVEISIYDAEDYARDMADSLAAMKTGTGVTIYTIGLGEQIRAPARGNGFQIIHGEPPPAEFLLQYIAQEAGDTLNPNISHGNYFYAPNSLALRNIFEMIARNIATKISQ